MEVEFGIVERESTRSQPEWPQIGNEDALIRELALASVPASVRVGRQFAARVLSEWEVAPEPIEDAVLIISELVTNAIRHGCPPVRLRLRKTWGEVEIEVDDGDHAMPRETRERLGGRGLPIVAALSRGWTADPTGTGKTVSSVLTVPA